MSINIDLYNDYIEGKCIEVWQRISFLEYNLLNDNEQKTINMIIDETLSRIYVNIKMVFKILNENGFRYKNFGNLNMSQNSVLLKSIQKGASNFYVNGCSGDVKIPFFFCIIL